MKKILTYCVLVASILVQKNVLAADEPRIVDAKNFDVAGIRLGMGETEVRQKLKRGGFSIENENYGINLKHPITGKAYRAHLNGKKGQEKILISFELNFADAKNKPTVVSSVAYEVPWSSTNTEMLFNSAIKKYGPPSESSGGAGGAWCANPTKYNSGCNSLTYRGAILKAGGAKVTLETSEYRDARRAYEEQSKVVAPSF